MNADDQPRLAELPWDTQLEEWENQGVQLLTVRRGDSRHPVIFVERQGVRYAIKETTPRMAEREIHNLQEIDQRGIPTLIPIGTVHVAVPPIAIDIPGVPGMRQYINGDRGYTVTRLAPRVVPHVLLYRLPLTRRIKQRLLAAVAALMVEMHEQGIYWGDPSLANALIRIDGKQIVAIMADAETTELFPGPLSEGLREQDLAQFGESLAWQAEDLRQAKGLPENVQVLDDSDYRYFRHRYHILSRKRAQANGRTQDIATYHTQGFLQTLSDVGSSLSDKAETVARQLIPVPPVWYQKRIYEMIHITIPRPYARRFYNLIVGHQEIMSKNEERSVSLDEAAHDWYERYHLPTILMLRQRLTNEQDPMRAYFEIMQHKWDMSMKAGYEIPLDKAIADWAQWRARLFRLNPVDPATLMNWWRHNPTTTNTPGKSEFPPIASDELDPLLTTAERPLIHLPPREIEQKLPEILHKEQEYSEGNAPSLEDQDDLE